MPTTLCFINQKGGVGKTTTCFHLAGAFASVGLRVLVVDIDPQGSISKAFLGPEVTEQLPLEATIGLLFDDERFFADRSLLVQPTDFDKMCLCSANSTLARFNDSNPDRWEMWQHCVSEFLGEYGQGFDLILIDCPPNLYLCSWSAMVASDYVLIPVPPEDFGTQGLNSVHQAVDEVRMLNPSLRRLGHIVTRRDSRLLIHRHIEGQLRDFQDGQVFETVISELNDFLLANSAQKPIEFFRPRGAAADLTRRLSREILDRIADKSARRRVA